MPVTAVMGAQWGDEGKGKLVDYLAGQSDLVIRYQGGANAGHTVVNERGTFKLRLVPSGIFNPGVECLLAPGVAVDPGLLLAEIDELAAQGVGCADLFIAERATLVMPWHKEFDRVEELARGDRSLGTTLRGIGPAFADRIARRAPLVADLLDRDWLADRVRFAASEANRLLSAYAAYGARPVDVDATIEDYWAHGQRLRERIVDSLAVVQRALRGGRRVLLESQAGVQRDPYWGTYPYVTSSSPLAGAASLLAGVPPHAIGRIIGVAKAYGTCVGTGPFPVGDQGELGDRLRRQGGEYGVVTGRPRRCGWFDAVATRYATAVAGLTELALTKLDVLDGFSELQICTGYRVGDRILETVPTLREMERAVPVYELLPGWAGSVAGARRFSDLPAAARRYVLRIEELVGVPIRLISVGQQREATIVV